MDKIRNDKIRKDLGVEDIKKKMESKQISWLGHLVRMAENRYAKRGWKMKMEGKRNRGPIKNGEKREAETRRKRYQLERCELADRRQKEMEANREKFRILSSTP